MVGRESGWFRSARRDGEMTKKVLIVEDNELNMKLFHDLLDAQGYETLQTREGLQALTLARQHRPDLILMDIQLPEISGLEVTKWLKDSGLVVNEGKTEICLFYKSDHPPIEIRINDKLIKSKKTINVLGVLFDSKLQWCEQVSQAIIEK